MTNRTFTYSVYNFKILSNKQLVYLNYFRYENKEPLGEISLNFENLHNNLPELYFSRQVYFSLLPSILSELGEVFVHSASAARSGKGMLIFGKSGSGKSTYLYKLMKRGWCMLADDITMVRVKDDKLIVYPSLPEFRTYFNVRNKGFERVFYPFTPKNTYRVNRFSIQPAEVTDIIVLTESSLKDIAGCFFNITRKNKKNFLKVFSKLLNFIK